MLPVTSLNSIPIGNGKVGPIFSKLINQWSQNTDVDIIKQIKDWNETDSNQELDAPTPYRFKRK